jgi:DNA-directed RNA polymerase subunit beta
MWHSYWKNYSKGEIPLQKRNCFVQSSDKAGDERCFIKSVPSLHGVVLDKKLFARAVKTNANVQDKDALGSTWNGIRSEVCWIKDKLVENFSWLLNISGCNEWFGEEVYQKVKNTLKKCFMLLKILLT